MTSLLAHLQKIGNGNNQWKKGKPSKGVSGKNQSDADNEDRPDGAAGTAYDQIQANLSKLTGDLVVSNKEKDGSFSMTAMLNGSKVEDATSAITKGLKGAGFKESDGKWAAKGWAAKFSVDGKRDVAEVQFSKLLSKSEIVLAGDARRAQVAALFQPKP